MYRVTGNQEGSFPEGISMKNVLFIDFETDILDKEKAKVIQLGAILVSYPDSLLDVFGFSDLGSVSFSSKIYSGTKIDPQAKSIHRIEEEDLEGCPVFLEVKEFHQMFQYADHIVAHNGNGFDFPILLRETNDPFVHRLFTDVAWFDTLVAARKLYKDSDSHRLGALLYEKELVSREERKALDLHDAGVDVWLCRLLFERMWIDSGINDLSEFLDWDKVIEPIDIMPFGKFKGYSLAQVRKEEESYLRWCLGQDWVLKERPDLILGILKEVEPESYEGARQVLRDSMRRMR